MRSRVARNTGSYPCRRHTMLPTCHQRDQVHCNRCTPSALAQLTQASNVHRAPLTQGDTGPSHPTGGARWKSCVPVSQLRPARCWTTHTGDSGHALHQGTHHVPECRSPATGRKEQNLQPWPHHARRRDTGRAAHLVHSSHQASNVHRAPLPQRDIGPT
jgi:hypothetical protein